MTRALLIVLLAAAPGCTFVFGAAGAGIASHKNHQDELARARRGEPAGSSSIMPGVLAGAGIGMLVDALVIGFVLAEIRDAEPPQLYPSGAGFAAN